ncbi:MAG: asparagine synthase C-terminal domain-containing protein, partial [Dehalococcoidia bacterium]|nr:asparagine synthase C-terminal domain-containing protein [Dehalococcoidia bacterium]
DVLPKVIWHFDEPFANITAIPAWYLCQMARQHVTVALAGAGGDEDFGGYPRYLAARILPVYFALPAALRNGVFKRLARIIPQEADGYSVFNRTQRFFLGADSSPEATYRNWVSFWPPGFALTLYTPHVRSELARQQTLTTVDTLLAEPGDEDLVNRIFYADVKTYLSDNLLTYSDRMASAHSLEMRVPFCDHRLVEFSATIPPNLKLKGFTLKYLLKKAMANLLPHGNLYRRKQGFSVPLGYWLQGKLLPLAKSALSTEKMKRRGYFNPSVIQTMLDEHIAGKADHSARLWTLIVFELWHTLYLDQNIVDEPSFSLHEMDLLV